MLCELPLLRADKHKPLALQKCTLNGGENGPG